MAKYVLTVKLGVDGASASVRDVETGRVASFTIQGPREIAQAFVKMLEANPEVEVKYK